MSDQKPNVLLICTDHWPGRLLRMAGHQQVMTPTLSQLARGGVYFPNAYSACPVCVPARRTLMTGLSPASHGLKANGGKPMPDVTTLPQAFRDAGYQATCVGKLHVFPPRSRIGFDEVILNEEGRRSPGEGDDYDIFLQDRGHTGKMFASGMCNNDYMTRPWHLPEECHPTNWATEQMCRTIRRRDPQKPGFWYLSYIQPHPPLWPLQEYLDLYRDVPVEPPVRGEWSQDDETLPWPLRNAAHRYSIGDATQAEFELAIRAFYALCTHIDHQIRVVIGTLREQQLIDNTIVVFTSDHGDMLGDHGIWAKQKFYESSANVPLIIMPAADDKRMEPGKVDNRVVELRDIMPTLLNLAGIEAPDHVEGISLASDQKREFLYGEVGYERTATRMIREDRYKLIYYPANNHVQLFDVENDRRDEHDLAGDPGLADVRKRLERLLIDSLVGDDAKWVKDGQLVGIDVPEDRPEARAGHRHLTGQRGLRYF